MPETLLEVRDLRVSFRTRQGVVTAVDGLSFAVEAGKVLGIVGESGSGKTVTVLAVLRLLTDTNCTITGEVIFRGENLLALSDSRMRAIRGREISMIALTPVYTVGWHIEEQVRAHERVSRTAARARAVQLLEEVGIPNPAQRV